MRSFTIILAFLLTGIFISVQGNDITVKTKNVAILVYDEVELLDFAGPGEVFQQAEFGGKKAFNVYTVAVDKKAIISQQFLKVTAQYNIDDCPMPDILVLPGGNSSAQAGNEKLIAWITAVNQKAEYVLSVCNGVRLLAKTGALDGKMATSHFRAVDNLAKEFPKVDMVKGKRFVDNGRIITTEGVSAGIDGSLYLLGKIFNQEVPKDVAKQMMYNWEPEALDVIIR